MESQLPGEWKICFSKSKGKVYYYNTDTKKVQWERPDEIKVLSFATNSSKRQRVETTKDKMEMRIRISLKVGMSSLGNVIHPWKHQIEAIREIIQHLCHVNVHNRFLVQHSTGSGKTITIAGLTHQLLQCTDKEGNQFHTVFVLTDRIVLDSQARSALMRFLMRNGVSEVFHAHSVSCLATLIQESTSQGVNSCKQQRVIISTAQKLSILVEDRVKMASLLQSRVTVRRKGFSRIAIIIDEAHRSHDVSTRNTMELLMQEAIQGNDVVFIGFSSTPSTRMLTLFGTSSSNEVLVPFHCYSISQAINDGIILNMISDYTYLQCSLQTCAENDILSDECDRRLTETISTDIDLIKAKCVIIAQHFAKVRENYNKAKAMIVARSRQDVVAYHQLITTLPEIQNHNWRIYASFSGSYCPSNGESSCETEKSLNGKQTLETAIILIVCEKLETGYNDPYLASLYLDRPINSSSRIVQVLSRVNRTNAGKKRVSVIDFSNHPAYIRLAFAVYWNQVIWTSESDASNNSLHMIAAANVLLDFVYDTSSQMFDGHFIRDETLFRLERDGIYQLRRALRTIVQGFKQHGHGDLILSTLLDYFGLARLAQILAKIENYTTSSKCIDPSMENSQTRTFVFKKIFNGCLHPDALRCRLQSLDDEAITRYGHNVLAKNGFLESREFAAFISAILTRSDIQADIRDKFKVLGQKLWAKQ